MNFQPSSVKPKQSMIVIASLRSAQTCCDRSTHSKIIRIGGNGHLLVTTLKSPLSSECSAGVICISITLSRGLFPLHSGITAYRRLLSRSTNFGYLYYSRLELPYCLSDGDRRFGSAIPIVPKPIHAHSYPTLQNYNRYQ